MFLVFFKFKNQCFLQLWYIITLPSALPIDFEYVIK